MFRKALTALRPPVTLIPEAFDIKLNITVQNHLKKIKTQVRNCTKDNFQFKTLINVNNVLSSEWKWRNMWSN